MSSGILCRWPQLVIACALTLLGVNGAAGQELEGPAPGAGLTVIWPDVPPDIITRVQAEHSTPLDPKARAEAIQRPLSDVRFLDPIRRRLVPVRWQAEVAGNAACQPGGPRFADLVSQALKALDFLHYDEAANLLSRAKLALVCDPEVATRDMLARYLFLSGVVQLHDRKGEGGGVFEAALAIAPDLPFPSDYSDAIRQAFAQAQKRTGTSALAPIRLDLEDMVGLELRIDGSPPVGNTLSLAVGTHFLQLIGPDGRAVTGMQVSLEASGDSSPVVWPPSEMRPPGELVIKTELQEAVAAGRMSTQLKTAIASEMKAGNHPWVLLIATDANSHAAQSLWVNADGTTEAHTLATGVQAGAGAKTRMEAGAPSGPGSGRADKISSSRSRRGLVVAGALGGGALISGGLYGYFYARAQQAPDLETWNGLYQKGLVTGVTTLACLSGAVISSTLTLFSHKAAHRQAGSSRHTSGLPYQSGSELQRADRARAGATRADSAFQFPTLQLVAGPQAVGLNIAGTW